jgi:uncharacterized protein (TIGR02001 family)
MGLNMLQRIKGIIVISSMLCGFVAASPAQAVDMESIFSDTEATDANIGLFSQYVWRGQRQSFGAMSLQGDVGIAHDSGLSANAWFATLGTGNATEFDFTLDYSADLGFMGYSAGLILYRYHNNGAANTSEVYVGATHELGSATVYYDTNSKNIWLDLGSSVELAEFSLEGTLSYSAPDIGRNEFVNLAVGVSKEIELDDVVFTPSFTYNYHMGAFDTVATPDALVFSVNMAY